MSSPRARLTAERSSFLPCLAVNVRLHARSDAVVEAHHRGDQAAALIFDFALTNNCAAVAFTECDREQVKVHAGETFWLRRRRPRRRPPPWMERKHRASELAPRQTALRAPVSPRISGVQCHGGNRRLRVQASILRRTSSSRREVPLLEALACASESRTHASASKHGRDAVFSVALAAVPCRRPLKIHRTAPRRAPTRRCPRRRYEEGTSSLASWNSSRAILGPGNRAAETWTAGHGGHSAIRGWTVLHLPSGGGPLPNVGSDMGDRD